MSLAEVTSFSFASACLSFRWCSAIGVNVVAGADTSHVTWPRPTLNFLTVIVFFGALGFLLPMLGASLVFQVSEAREGSVVQEMLRTGNFILPLRNGEIVPSKPPLYHWISAVLQQVVSASPEFLLRLPSALAAAGCCAIVVFGTGPLFGLQFAVMSAAVLLLTSGFHQLAMDGRVDMVFTLFVAAAVLPWFQWRSYAVEAGSKFRTGDFQLIWFALCTGCAVLVKGPLGAVLPLLAIAVTAFVQRSEFGWRQLIRWPWLLCLIVPLPWYLAAAVVGGEEFLWRVGFENIGRFRGDEGITAKPFWFYFQKIWDFCAPWSFVALAGGVFWWKLKSRARSQKEDTLSAAQHSFVQLSCWWMALAVLMFSLSSGKRVAYLLVLLPVAAPVFVAWVRVLLDRDRRALSPVLERPEAQQKLRSFLRVFCWIVTVAAVLLLVMALLPVPTFFPQLGQDAWRGFTLAVEQNFLAFLGFSAVFGGLSFWFLSRSPSTRSAISSFLALTAWVLSVHLSIGVAAKGFTHSYRRLAHEVSQRLTEGSELTLVKKRLDESYDVFLFYLGIHVRMMDPQADPTEPGLYLARRAWLESQPPTLRERGAGAVCWQTTER